MTILQELESRLAAALTTVLGEPASAAVTPAADLRFGELREMDVRRKDTVNHRMIFAWNYEPEAAKDRLIRDRPPKPDVKQALVQIATRIVGQGGETWQAAPRLADVPGSFPEPLDVIE